MSTNVPDLTEAEKEVQAANQPVVDWDPTPGFVLIKTLKREEVAEQLYGKKTAGPTLSLPDKMGKISDSVGVGRVIKVGMPDRDELLEHIEIIKFEASIKEKGDSVGSDLVEPLRANNASWLHYKVGDYVSFMPYTDLIIEIDGAKYSILPYSAIRGVRKG